MRFKTVSAGIFLCSFTFGCVAVMFFGKSETPVKIESEKVNPPITQTTSLTETKSTIDENPFMPEIFGLKDFDDLRPNKYKFKFVDVLEHGNFYRRDELIARNGETWLGLFSESGEVYLKNTKLKVKYDYDPDWEGAEIQLKGNKPLFIVKNAKILKEGKVMTLFQENRSENVDFEDRTNVMYRGFSKDFQLGDKKYSLRIKDAQTKSGENAIALVLETEGVSQVVTYGPYFDGDYLGSLLWVGDLDGDGKLDFYLNYNDWEKGYFRSSLFLSSEAEKRKLVKEAAGFFTAGC